MSYSLNQISSAFSVKPPSSLIAWYKFDDNDVTFDGSGNAYNLVNNGARFDAANFKTGNGSIKLNSNNGEYFSLHPGINFYAIASTNGITFAMWVKIIDDGIIWSLLYFTNQDGNNSVNLLNNNQALLFLIDDKSANIPNMIDNNWHHIVLSISSSGKWTIYKDGTNLDVNVTKQFANTNYITRGFGILFDPNASYVHANIDDLRIYNKAISQEEVTAIYSLNYDVYNIGIGVKAADSYKLFVNGTTKISSGGRNVALIGLGSEDLNYTKCAFGHVRENINDQGSIVFLNRPTADTTSCDLTNEVIRITNSNVAIAKHNPDSHYKLDIGGSINANKYFLNGNEILQSSAEWNTNINTLSITSNVVIGSELSGTGRKLEIYNGDITIIDGNLKKYISTDVINNTCNILSDVWYQFDNSTNTLYDKNTGTLNINFDLTIPLASSTVPPVPLISQTIFTLNGDSYIYGITYNNITYGANASTNTGTDYTDISINFTIANLFDNNVNTYWQGNALFNTKLTGAYTQFTGYYVTSINDTNEYYIKPYLEPNGQDFGNSYSGEFINLKLSSAITPTAYSFTINYADYVTPRKFGLFWRNNNNKWRMISEDEITAAPLNTNTVQKFTYNITQVNSSNFLFMISRVNILNSYDIDIQQATGLLYAKPRIREFNLISSSSYHNITDGYITSYNSALQKAFLWDTLLINPLYNTNANNIVLLLNKIHDNKTFTVHFVFRTNNNNKSFDILTVRNSSKTLIKIRYDGSTTCLQFDIGTSTVTTLTNTANTILNNVFYVIQCMFSYTLDGKIQLKFIIYNGSSTSIFTTISATNVYANLFQNVDKTNLKLEIGNNSDAGVVYLQDFRIIADELGSSQLISLQSGGVQYNKTTNILVYQNYAIDKWYGSNYIYTYDNVGIGTNNVEKYNLNVNGKINATGFCLSDVAISSSTNNMWTSNNNCIYTNSNVGIGTTTNSIYKLNVKGNLNVMSGEITVTSNITAFASDDRLKIKLGNIKNALQIVSSLSTFQYEFNELAQSYGFKGGCKHYGVSAQEVEHILPELVSIAPFDRSFTNNIISSASGSNYLTVDYDRMIPVLIEAIKELKTIDDDNKSKLLCIKKSL